MTPDHFIASNHPDHGSWYAVNEGTYHGSTIHTVSTCPKRWDLRILLTFGDVWASLYCAQKTIRCSVHKDITRVRLVVMSDNFVE